MLAAAFRCAEKPRLPLYAGIASALLNTVLNDLLIFGKCGFAAMGATGAGIATVLSQWVNFLLMLLFCRKTPPLPAADGRRTPPVRGRGRQYLAMLLPLLICEVTWSLGENVYAAIYGRMGTDASAAMTLTAPVQGLAIGALCGLSQAAASGLAAGTKTPPMRRAGACSSTALPGPRCCPCSWCCSAVSMWRSIRWRTG